MYKLNQTSGIIRLSDSAGIPADPANIDYANYLAWLAAGNTPEPADIPDPKIAIDAKLSQLRQVREEILNRLGGIAGRANRKGDKTTADACDVAVQGLLDITKDLPADIDAITLEVLARYRSIVTMAATATPGLISAFIGVDL